MRVPKVLYTLGLIAEVLSFAGAGALFFREGSWFILLGLLASWRTGSAVLELRRVLR